MNFVKGHVTGPSQVECSLGTLSIAVPPGVTVASPVMLSIPPEHVRLSSHNGSPASLSGTIARKNSLGDAVLLEVEVNGVTLMAKLAGDVEFSVGERAAVELSAHRWHVFP